MTTFGSAFQTRTLPSELAVTTCLPSAVNVADRTKSLCPRSTARLRPCVGSQSRAVVSPAVTTNLPPGLKLTSRTGPVWPISWARLSPVDASQTRAVASSLAVATYLPLWLKTARSSGPRCPRIVTSRAPDPASQIRAIPSPPAVTIRSPSGENSSSDLETLLRSWRTTTPVCASHRRTTSSCVVTRSRSLGLKLTFVAPGPRKLAIRLPVFASQTWIYPSTVAICLPCGLKRTSPDRDRLVKRPAARARIAPGGGGSPGVLKLASSLPLSVAHICTRRPETVATRPPVESSWALRTIESLGWRRATDSTRSSAKALRSADSAEDRVES